MNDCLGTTLLRRHNDCESKSLRGRGRASQLNRQGTAVTNQAAGTHKGRPSQFPGSHRALKYSITCPPTLLPGCLCPPMNQERNSQGISQLVHPDTVRANNSTSGHAFAIRALPPPPGAVRGLRGRSPADGDRNGKHEILKLDNRKNLSSRS